MEPLTLPDPSVAGAAPPPPVVFSRIGPATGHDVQTKAEIARWLAVLMGARSGGEIDGLAPAAGPRYLVPSETVHGLQAARGAGIHGPQDLFGGVVPHAFVGTKVIGHPLIGADARAPDGWSAEFAEDVRDVVLPGYTAFSHADAREAGRRLLAQGRLRLKKADGVGGRGQAMVTREQDLMAQLETLSADEMATHGLALEAHIDESVTLSVGEVRIGRWTAAYVGTQHTTRNAAGHTVYGGSTLNVRRGTLDELARTPLAFQLRLAVEQALAYHRAAFRRFAGMFASRCNYDVLQGLDSSGRWRSGVLEQSWRIGGASGAEVAALLAFQTQPGLAQVQARSRDVYGGIDVPPGARVSYDGTDPQVGRLTKFVQVTADADA